MLKRLTFTCCLIIFAWHNTARAQDTSSQDLAKALANPISSLVSVPIQMNYDGGFGPEDGNRVTTNIQPVIPLQLDPDLTLVVRTILPVIWQNDIAGESGTQFGLSDTLQSFFVVPAARSISLGNLTVGAGPAVTWPTSTDELLGLGTLGLGPTAVGLIQSGPWTYGALVAHQWGVAETRDGVPYLNSTFMQPFLSYTTPDAITYSANLESSYNWETDEWSVPINLQVSKLTAIGTQKIQLQAGIRYWAEAPENGAEGFGGRLAITFLFPN